MHLLNSSNFVIRQEFQSSVHVYIVTFVPVFFLTFVVKISFELMIIVTILLYVFGLLWLSRRPILFVLLLLWLSGRPMPVDFKAIWWICITPVALKSVPVDIKAIRSALNFLLL